MSRWSRSSTDVLPSLRRAGLAAAVAAGLVLLLSGIAVAADSNVTMSEAGGRYVFFPKTQFVNVGGSVTWTNSSDAPHTVTSDTGSTLASGTINAGKTFSTTFSTVGSFAYHCTIHPYMHGTIRVLAAGKTAPPTDAAPAPASATPDSAPIVTLGFLAIALGGLAGFGLLVFKGRRSRSA